MPPSEPTARNSSSFLDIAAVERPTRVPLTVALVLAVVLVAIPLYLWRRPRAGAIDASDGSASTEPKLAPPKATPTAAPPPNENDEKPLLGAAKVLACSGTTKRPTETCEHVSEIDRALQEAIEKSALCVPKDSPGGSIVYLVEVNGKRKGVHVTTPRTERTLKSPQTIHACLTAVRHLLTDQKLEAFTHGHYEASIVATYPALRTAR
jgi:hypothetical protein